MMQPLPKQSPSQSIGEIGVNIVSLKVHQSLGWNFRRTPQELDFGIDGYIDIVTDEGYVTGKSIAVQIKTGTSYLRDGSNTETWRYVGDLKHINYYINHHTPVLLLLVDPQNHEIWWRQFSAYETEKTRSGWTTEISKSSYLDDSSKQELNFIAGHAKDYLSHLDDFWNIGHNAKDNDLIILHVTRTEIETRNVRVFASTIKRLSASRTILCNSMGKIDFLIMGYDEDKRELYEIPEVRLWIKIMVDGVKELAYFLWLDDYAQGIVTIAACLCNAKKIDDQRVEFTDIIPLLEFMDQQFEGLNELTETFNIEDYNKPVSMRFGNKIREIIGATTHTAG